MRNKVSSVETIPFAGINANSLFKNSYEQRVMNDFIKAKRYTVIQLKQDMLDKCTAANDWEIDDALGVKQQIAKDSSVCRN